MSFEIKKKTPFAIKQNARRIKIDGMETLKNAEIQNKMAVNMSNMPRVLIIMDFCK